MHALILAAGKGTRLRPITDNIAKPAIPFLNIPLMGFPLYHLEQSGLSHLVVNTHYQPESIHKTIKKLSDDKSYQVTFSDEQPDILGSGGAIVRAKDSLTNDNIDNFFIYANGDEMMLFDHGLAFGPLIDAHKKRGGLATMMLCHHPEVGTRFNGVWIDQQSKLVGIGKEQIGQNTNGLHFTGVMVLSTEIFKYLPSNGECNILHDGLLPALNDGQDIYGHIEDSLTWFETGDPESFLSATASCTNLISKNSGAANNLKSAIQRYYPNSIRQDNMLSGSNSLCQASLNGSFLVMGDYVRIAADTKLIGFNIIGDHCEIKGNVKMENCVIAEVVSPMENCQLNDCIQVGNKNSKDYF